MQRGYVKLWRKTFDAGWLKNHKLWVFWCWCLLKASHKEYDMIVGCQQVHLMPGDFVTGLSVAAKETGLSVQETRTALTTLSTHQNITIKSTNKFSVVSIVNWDTYQGEDITDQQTDQQTTNKQLTTNKNVKNIKNIYRGAFQIPSLQEITLYCLERKNQIKPQVFIDHYLSNGWMVGKNKMKDWKAAVRKWEQSNFGGDNGNRQTFNTNKRNYGADRELSPEVSAEADEINRKYYAAKQAAAAGKPKENAGRDS